MTTVTATAPGYLKQKIEQNTLLATASITSQFKLSAGWRFKNREVADSGPDDLTWHENGVILGAVVQPSRAVRLNVNFDGMNSKSANAATTSNTFTREAPNKLYHFRARTTVMPAKWINFAIATNDSWGKNDDPFVNHSEHSRDLSFATSIMPVDGVSLDFNYAHDDVFSRTDLCYVFTPNANAPLPAGAANSGTCVLSTSNPSGAANLFLGNGTYNAPTNFFSGAINYAPSHYFRFNGGARFNNTNGTAEQLNPLMVPGALQSKYLTPFADLQINIAQGWAWHGNWTHDAYTEQGPVGTTAARDTHGDILTFGVKYAF
jgi:hypothetical protein